MSTELAIFVVVVIAIVGWFALGTHINVRKGHRFLEWLQGGLPLVGEKTTLRWLGSSVVHLQIEKARDPFRRVEVLVVLEPRDVPPLWLLSRLRGRRDLLIVRTELRSVPKVQVEILDRQAWSTRAVDKEVREQQWDSVSSHQTPFQVYALPPVANIADLADAAARPEPITSSRCNGAYLPNQQLLRAPFSRLCSAWLSKCEGRADLQTRVSRASSWVSAMRSATSSRDNLQYVGRTQA